jgi:head-tail adaptor
VSANVGAFDTRIAIYKEQLTETDSGGNDVSLVLRRRCWAKKVETSGNEKRDFDRLNAVAKCAFMTRNFPDVVESDVIQVDSVYYTITAVLVNTKRDLYMTIECERGRPT